MGEDGAALSWQAARSRPPRQGQSTICRGRAVDRPNRQSLAGSGALVRPLEQCLHALPRLGEGGYLEAAVRRRLRPDMEYAMVDATIVKVHRHGQGAKGGPKARRSAVRRAA